MAVAEKKFKLGILGTGGIVLPAVIQPARKSTGFEITAVASRDRARAEAFARQHAIPGFYAGYEALLESDAIDCVYLAVPNDLHTEWICRAAQAGKHILAEKPLCLSRAEFERIQRAVGDHGVHLLEAIMVQHHPWQGAVRSLITQGVYGRLNSLQTQIAFNLPPKQAYRLSPEKGGGAFYDLGSYWLQFLQVCSLEEPEGWEASANIGPEGVDMTFNATARYASGLSAKLACSFERPMLAKHRLEFEDATITVGNFFCAAFGDFSLVCEISRRGSTAREKLKFPPQNYYVNQLEFFGRVLAQEADNLPLGQTGQRARWLETIHALAGKNREGK